MSDTDDLTLVLAELDAVIVNDELGGDFVGGSFRDLTLDRLERLCDLTLDRLERLRIPHEIICIGAAKERPVERFFEVRDPAPRSIRQTRRAQRGR